MKTYNINVNFGKYWMEYKDCYFIENLDTYKEYMIELNNRFSISESEIKTLKTFIGHGHSHLTELSGLFCGMIDEKNERTPMLDHLKYLHGTLLSDQLKTILNGNILVINKKGGYFHIKKDQEYNINNTNIKYTTKDISIKKWWGGKHYYAKVGNIDVIDDDGDLKWNTEQYAYDTAVKFMNKLNNM